MVARVNSSTVPKLVSAVLDLLDTDRLPQAAGETGVVSCRAENVPIPSERVTVAVTEMTGET